MISERWHKVGETRLNYASTEGTASPLVFLHVVLRDASHEFLTKPSEPLIRALLSFLEAIRD